MQDRFLKHIRSGKMRSLVLRLKHREQGLCWDCASEATHGCRCEYHWRKYKALDRKHARVVYERRKVNGLCVRCGVNLNGDMDGGHFECLNCREEIVRPTKPQRRYYDYNTAQKPPNAI